MLMLEGLEIKFANFLHGILLTITLELLVQTELFEGLGWLVSRAITLIVP